MQYSTKENNSIPLINNQQWLSSVIDVVLSDTIKQTAEMK